MAIAPANQHRDIIQSVFHELHELFNDLNAEGFLLDTLSMGMTDDFELAIAEGSTCIRIGRAIFGERK